MKILLSITPDFCTPQKMFIRAGIEPGHRVNAFVAPPTELPEVVQINMAEDKT